MDSPTPTEEGAAPDIPWSVAGIGLSGEMGNVETQRGRATLRRAALAHTQRPFGERTLQMALRQITVGRNNLAYLNL